MKAADCARTCFRTESMWLQGTAPCGALALKDETFRFVIFKND